MVHEERYVECVCVCVRVREARRLASGCTGHSRRSYSNDLLGLVLAKAVTLEHDVKESLFKPTPIPWKNQTQTNTKVHVRERPAVRLQLPH